MLIARRVRALLDEGLLVQDGKVTRPVEPCDVAVLSRTWASLVEDGAALATVVVSVVEAGAPPQETVDEQTVPPPRR